MLFDWWIVASEFLDPGPHPLQRGFRRMALTSSSGPHEQRLDLPKLLAQLQLAVHSDPVARSEPGSPHHRARRRRSSRPRYPEHSAQVKPGNR
ncbi:hypothetical protein ACQ5SK_23430 [Bradyrhizobium japonicum]